MREQEAERSGTTSQRPQPSPVESQVLALVRQEMAAFQARFSVLEGRVLRPLLVAPKPPAAQRIMGLDDSVTAEEVVAAVARTGGCSADEVKAGTIRPDFRGTCTVTVSCPVVAAKTIVGGRRLLVGWVSAQVKLLDPRPLRCFRCHVGHHVGVRCTSEVDRSALCFRCGQPGHKAVACSAAPHCTACAAAGKPAEHRAGSKSCAPPAKTKDSLNIQSLNVSLEAGYQR
ncbi:uncharacterized protein LOC124639653 [Helicoverpa zea]|uniref:uncharacterized protein LOC124639653 n=1 Tax=Helicoverpa zea TaxID=7113 RepID=UPI001F56A06C|nr:uncharacterized protein LOC124639653 [Helicoverpa zea]